MTQLYEAMIKAVEDHPPIRFKRALCDALEGEMNRARAEWEKNVDQLEAMMHAEIARRLKEGKE